MFQTKLIFWTVFLPKVRAGSRNDLCLGHIGQNFSGESKKIILLTDLAASGTGHHHTQH